MNEQPESLRLAKALDQLGADIYLTHRTDDLEEAVIELRRLQTSEREGWRYADELEQSRKKLETSNSQLIAALGAMLTHMGMDEVQEAINAIKSALEQPATVNMPIIASEKMCEVINGGYGNLSTFDKERLIGKAQLLYACLLKFAQPAAGTILTDRK